MTFQLGHGLGAPALPGLGVTWPGAPWPLLLGGLLGGGVLAYIAMRNRRREPADAPRVWCDDTGWAIVRAHRGALSGDIRLYRVADGPEASSFATVETWEQADAVAATVVGKPPPRIETTDDDVAWRLALAATFAASMKETEP